MAVHFDHQPAGSRREDVVQSQRPRQYEIGDADQSHLELCKHLVQKIDDLYQVYNTRNRIEVDKVVHKTFAPTCIVEGDARCVLIPPKEAGLQPGDGFTHLMRNPALRIAAYDPTATVDMGVRRARVITGTTMTGSVLGNLQIMRESFIIFEFRREWNDEWLCYKVAMIKGPGYHLYGIEMI